MTNFLQTLVNSGLHRTRDEALARRIRLTNIFTMVMTLTGIIYVPVYIGLGLNWLASFAALLVPVYFSTLLLNRAGRFDAARISFCLYFNLVIFAYARFTGAGSGLGTGFVITLVLPFVFFGRSRQRLIVLLSAWAGLCFLAFLLADYVRPAPGLLSPEASFFMRLSVTATICLIVGICVYIVNDDARTAENKLGGMLDDKRVLLGILSHDLRTPLNILAGGQRLLEKVCGEHGPPAAMKVLVKQRNAIDNLVEMLDNVHFLQGLEEGKIQVEPGGMTWDTLTVRLTEAFGPGAAMKDITLEFRNPDDLEEIPADDRFLVHSIVGNLLSNAIKFSGSGGLVVVEAGFQGAETRISVRDQGRGIPGDLRRH